jgi:magnesium transporter
LCISTGGNSGSQAATLITRAMALGQISHRDWPRVLRHEFLMGLVLGITLGIIGYGRAALTPESVRSSSPPRPEPFQAKVSKDTPLVRKTVKEGWLWMEKAIEIVEIPRGTQQVMLEEHDITVALPEGATLTVVDDPNDPQFTLWNFPANCRVHHPPVDRYRLSLVIALAVASICLWGTLVGSMLPLFFRRIGIDPGIASSPFVATFVDVTGIIIYFTIAKYLLGQYLV